LFSDEFTVLVLYCISLSVIPDPTALGIFAILQILMFIGAILRKHSSPHFAPLSLNILHRRSLHDRSHWHRYARRLRIRSRCLVS
jgi:hypothetical protein